MRRLLVAVVLSIACVLAACGGSDESTPANEGAGTNSLKAPDKTLVVAVNSPFPPWISHKGDTYSGLDYEVMTAIAEKTGIKFKVVRTGFEAIIPGAISGRYDLLMGGFGDNPTRRKNLDVLDWWRSYPAMLARKDTPYAEAKDLCGKKVGVAPGTTDENNFPKLSKFVCGDGEGFVKVPLGYEGQLPGLKAGRIDGLAGSNWNNPSLLEQQPSIKQVGGPIRYGDKTDLGGLVVPKRNKELLPLAQQGLKAIIEDGTYDRIFKKYDIESGAYREATINATPAS